MGNRGRSGYFRCVKLQTTQALKLIFRKWKLIKLKKSEMSANQVSFEDDEPPPEAPREGWILVRIYVPELDTYKCLQFPVDKLLWDVKQQVLASLPKVRKAKSYNQIRFFPFVHAAVDDRKNIIWFTFMMTSDDVPIDVCATGENLWNEKNHRSEFHFFEFHARNVTRRQRNILIERCNWNVTSEWCLLRRKNRLVFTSFTRFVRRHKPPCNALNVPTNFPGTRRWKNVLMNSRAAVCDGKRISGNQMETDESRAMKTLEKKWILLIVVLIKQLEVVQSIKLIVIKLKFKNII